VVSVTDLRDHFRPEIVAVLELFIDERIAAAFAERDSEPELPLVEPGLEDEPRLSDEPEPSS
jgi:hypothetical protein